MKRQTEIRNILEKSGVKPWLVYTDSRAIGTRVKMIVADNAVGPKMDAALKKIRKLKDVTRADVFETVRVCGGDYLYVGVYFSTKNTRAPGPGKVKRNRKGFK